jgi:GAF domain-containing protein
MSIAPPQPRRLIGSETIRYLIFGVTFGLLFPIVATLVRIQTLQLPLSLATMLEIQRTDPLLWIIDSAPLFLGIFAAIAGYRQDVLHWSNRELRQSESELQAMRANLEQRVKERTAELVLRSEELATQSQELAKRSEGIEQANRQATRRAAQLQALSEVVSSIASIQNLDELLPRITHVISREFRFYHVGIFLVDNTGEYAVLSAANSEGGQRMLARRHALKVGEVGIVGHVTGSGEPRVALDTVSDAIFFDNPDLPDTHSEMALPLTIAGEVIGALDVQSAEPDAIDSQDQEILTTLASQVSIAIQNARAYEEAQRALAESESIYRRYIQREWRRHTREHKTQGYWFKSGRSLPLGELVRGPEITQASSTGDLMVGHDKNGATVVAVPIKLRQQVIGVLNIRSDTNRKFTRDELDLMQAVAERVALSAENARLLEETSDRAEREKTVAEISNKIRSTNDPGAMIETAMRELKSALGASQIRLVPANAAHEIDDAGH